MRADAVPVRACRSAPGKPESGDFAEPPSGTPPGDKLPINSWGRGILYSLPDTMIVRVPAPVLIPSSSSPRDMTGPRPPSGVRIALTCPSRQLPGTIPHGPGWTSPGRNFVVPADQFHEFRRFSRLRGTFPPSPRATRRLQEFSPVDFFPIYFFISCRFSG